MAKDSKTVAEQIIGAIIRHSAGDGVGRTELNLAFYFAHLFYSEQNPGILSDWPVVRTRQGPGIGGGRELLLDLVHRGVLEKEWVWKGPFQTVRFRLKNASPAEPFLAPNAEAAIGAAADYVRGQSLSDLLATVRAYSRSWNKAADGDELDLYIDTIPEDEYEEREAGLQALDQELPPVFGPGLQPADAPRTDITFQKVVVSRRTASGR